MTTHHTEPTGDAAEAPEAAKIGPYQLLAQLGSGAMGRVFLGVDGSGRQAAVKVVRSDLAEVPAFLKRFARELDVAQRVHGPHIAEIYDSQPDGPQPWLATEYVPGPTLQEAIERGGVFDSRRLRALASAIADALKGIHAADVVHRDLKPSNVLLGPDGPKVIDFGVARAIDASLLTNTGQTLGTPAYMSPEQADGRLVQPASDVFAVGALLVFAATGRLAFGDGPPLAILHRVVNNEPELDGVADDDAELRGLVERCLEKDPEDRPSPQELIDAIGAAPWEPLTGVAWQQQPLGVGLPLTVKDAADPADAPTVALGPKGNRGKRIAVISGATLAALVLAAVAVVEGVGGGNDKPATKGSAKVGDPMSGAANAGGSFPTGGDGSSSTSSSTPTASSSSSASSPGSPAAPVNPGSAGGASSGATTSAANQNPGGQSSNSQTSRGNTSAPPNTSKPSTSKTTSQPAPPPQSTSSAAPPPAHNPPAPFVAGEIKVNIPPWFGMATVDVTWPNHADATSYVLHYTVSDGTDKTVPINGTSYSYQIPAGSNTCIQMRTVNQYGQSVYFPDSMSSCFNANG